MTATPTVGSTPATLDGPVPLGAPTYGQEEIDAVAAVLASGWVAGQGPTSARFEQAFASAVGREHALAMNNCTAALHVALLTLGADAGDEVIVADYTYPATGHSVMYTGATPVFADVRADTWTVDPAAVEALITPRTVGVIAVDTLGQCADYAELQAMTAARGLFLIEDAACSTGATYQGAPAGSFGDISCFSFHGRKGITSGEGGALATNNADWATASRKTHAFGVESALARAGSSGLPVPVFDALGYNYKLSDIASAIMEVQLRRLPDLVAIRQSVARRYEELFADLAGPADSDAPFALPYTAPDRTHSWQTYALTLNRAIDRGAVAMELRARGIQCNIGTFSSHVQPVYASEQQCPVASDLFDRHLAIPMHANLTEAQIDRVATTVRAVIAGR